jgi:hypothetical protein
MWCLIPWLHDGQNGGGSSLSVIVAISIEMPKQATKEVQ